MSTQTIQPLQEPLTSHDRCDGCGAQAYVRVTLVEGELLFCAHHYGAAADKLEPVALHLQDERSKLDPPPLPVE